MSTPPKADQVRLFDALAAQIEPGSYVVRAHLEVTLDGGEAWTSPQAAHAMLDVTGPWLRLPPSEVLGVYPPAGAEDSAWNFLPHVTLRRRTLPWERRLPGEPSVRTPWLALLLVAEGEGALLRDQPASLLGDPFAASTETCDQLSIAPGTLRALLPRSDEVALLCHAREVPRTDALGARDDDGYVAIVMGSRLPSPATSYHACLVSLQGIWKTPGLWPDQSASGAGAAALRLPVLHSWGFKTGTAGDFEAYWSQLARLGGDRAFGQSTGRDALLDPLTGARLVTLAGAGPDSRVLFGGPLVPAPMLEETQPVTRAADAWELSDAAVPVASYAAAFELGRLLALGSPAVLDSLVRLREAPYSKDKWIEQLVLVDDGPPTGPPPRDPQYLFGQLVDDGLFDPVPIERLRAHGADPTGIAHLMGRAPGLSGERLSGVPIGAALTARLTAAAPAEAIEPATPATQDLSSFAGVRSDTQHLSRDLDLVASDVRALVLGEVK